MTRPPSFSIGLGLLGLVLLVFPSLRVAGLLALLLAVTYTIQMWILEPSYRDWD